MDPLPFERVVGGQGHDQGAHDQVRDGQGHQVEVGHDLEGNEVEDSDDHEAVAGQCEANDHADVGDEKVPLPGGEDDAAEVKSGVVGDCGDRHRGKEVMVLVVSAGGSLVAPATAAGGGARGVEETQQPRFERHLV